MIAYITTSYPALSHTFILREVEALRRRGVDVATTAVHAASATGLLSEENRRAHSTTYAILPARWTDVVRSHAEAFVRHPGAFIRTLRHSMSLRRPGFRGLLWQVFYFGEAITAWRHWRRLGVRHVHAHFVTVPADIAMLATHFGRLTGNGPSTWSFTVHGLIEFWDAHPPRVADKIREADAIVCVSDFTRSQVMSMVEPQFWPKVSVIRCGIRTDRYSMQPEPRSRPCRILCVARLVPEKGQSLLIEAVASLVRRGVDVDLELVGDGPTRGALEAQARRLGIDARVRFAGAVGQDDIASYYERCTVFCLPSFNEALPVVLMEAMASGRAVVATAVAGVSELVRDGETGILVSAGRSDQLADALATLLEDAHLRRRIVNSANELVRRRHDVDRSAKQLEVLFEDIVAGVREHDAASFAGESAVSRRVLESSGLHVVGTGERSGAPLEGAELINGEVINGSRAVQT